MTPNLLEQVKETTPEPGIVHKVELKRTKEGWSVVEWVHNDETRSSGSGHEWRHRDPVLALGALMEGGTRLILGLEPAVGG